MKSAKIIEWSIVIVGGIVLTIFGLNMDVFLRSIENPIAKWGFIGSLIALFTTTIFWLYFGWALIAGDNWETDNSKIVIKTLKIINISLTFCAISWFACLLLSYVEIKSTMQWHTIFVVFTPILFATLIYFANKRIITSP